MIRLSISIIFLTSFFSRWTLRMFHSHIGIPIGKAMINSQLTHFREAGCIYFETGIMG